MLIFLSRTSESITSITRFVTRSHSLGLNRSQSEANQSHVISAETTRIFTTPVFMKQGRQELSVSTEDIKKKTIRR
jgi:hypothetical protein